MLKDRGRRVGLALVLVGLVSVAASAVRWSPGELDVAQAPGTEETYRLTLQNDSAEVAELRLYVADWIRDEDGVNDFGVARNGARWEIDRAISAGESVVVRYAVRLPKSGSIGVDGTFRTWAPQEIDSISGVSKVAADAVGDDGGTVTRAFVSVARSVESVDESGLATVVLTVRTAIDFVGLTIEEIYDARVEMTSVDAAGGRFDTVNRSCADWVSLSRGSVRLDPDESTEITMAVSAPEGYEGMYWCILMAESADVVVGEIGGTRIITRPSVGLKVFVSAPGTLVPSANLTGIRVVGLNPVAVEATFVNTGNVQLVVTGEAQVVDAIGEVVRAFLFSEHGRDYFRILPGSERTVTLVDYSGAEALPVGVYQAIVSFDYGGDALIAGAKAFRVR